jgi:hypothetical protein
MASRIPLIVGGPATSAKIPPILAPPALVLAAQPGRSAIPIAGPKSRYDDLSRDDGLLK